MPAAVHAWSTKNSISDVSQMHNDILHTYRDDFGKYGGRIPPQRLQEVITAVPRCLGQKFVYSIVKPKRAIPIDKGCTRTTLSSKSMPWPNGFFANGVPLQQQSYLHPLYTKLFLLGCWA